MLRLERVDPTLLDLPRKVVETLRDHHGVDPDLMMLVGARCRDILHSAFGHSFAVTATTDVDFGLALSDWDLYARLSMELTPTGDSGVAYFVAGIPVDLMPFGQVETPPGSSEPPRRGEPLDVAGFHEVYQSGCLQLQLGEKLQVKVASPVGYTALKLKAWADRSKHHQYKDAGDLALACFWYCNDDALTEQLWEDPAHLAVLEQYGFDQDLAAISALGRSVHALLGEATLALFRTAWSAATLPPLVTYFGSPRIPAWSTQPARRRELIQALTAAAGLTE